MSTAMQIEPLITRDPKLGPGKPKPKADDRQTAVAVGLSRAGLRLTPEQVRDAVAAVLAELDRLGLKTAPAPLQAVPDPHECAPCTLPHVEKEPEEVWQPKRKNKRTAAKNPKAGVRVCSMCLQEKSTKTKSTGLPGGHFVLHREKTEGNKLSSRCRDCLNAAARNRYLSTKRLAAMNMLRLAFVADDEVAGLRCLDCQAVFAVGDEVVACSGLRHEHCDQDARW